MIRIGYGMKYGKRGLARSLLVAAALVFLFMSMAGILLSGMSMGMGDDMQGCPFMMGSSICHMSLFEHIASWQTMFAATERLSIILLVALSALGFVFFLSKYFYPPPRYFSTQKLTRTIHEPHRFTQALLEAFSAGILNPKLF